MVDVDVHVPQALVDRGRRMKGAIDGHKENTPLEASCLTRPVEEWEKSDLRKPGEKVFILQGSSLYRVRYELIDWSK